MSKKSSDINIGALAIGAIAGAIATTAVKRISSKQKSEKATVPLKSIKNVGILGMEVYTPSTYITQESLEKHNGVPQGKYTIGLGQEAMGICSDCEDVNSLALTVVHSLMEKYNISPEDVGRLEVGTETLVDKSKSTKTILMDLFKPNCNIEGATVVNACYGGTSALLNAFHWAESDGWDGRYAIVVAADIAAYAAGPARPTCGAGAVALLVGRDAPLVFDPKARASSAENVWDFFKPDHTVEYPVVNGKVSAVCYYRALDTCYNLFADKMDKISKTTRSFDITTPDYFVFHSPYNKLVQKSYGRLFLLDARRKHLKECINDEEKKNANFVYEEGSLSQWINVPLAETYVDKALDAVLKKISGDSLKEKMNDSNFVSKHIGNTYTASVFFGLASLIDRAGGRGDLTPGKKIVMFSYGSGSIASMYGLTVRKPSYSKFTIELIAKSLNLMKRLKTRELVDASELDFALDTRARMHNAGVPYSPLYPSVGRLFPGTYYLTGIDSNWIRSYERIPIGASTTRGERLVPSSVVELERKEKEKIEEQENSTAQCPDNYIITGVAAALPGDDHLVFDQNNMTKLVEGRQCIKRIGKNDVDSLLEKNVVQVKKLKDGTTKRFPVTKPEQTINVAGQVGSFSLNQMFGVPQALETTMDIATKLAVGAGLEAMKDAGLISGKTNDIKEWQLPDEFRDNTGIVYASSFPAMDAAIEEVMRFVSNKTAESSNINNLLSSLTQKYIEVNGELTVEDEAVFTKLKESFKGSEDEVMPAKYEINRKFLFKVLLLGNAQLAQITGCRGPNTQTNAACAGTTQAIAIAQDMIYSGRADRVVVISGDNASGSTLLPWLGNGFRALGAACINSKVEESALPFDKRRCGMILGAGGVGLVVEKEASVVGRRVINSCVRAKARLLATQYSNSAYHGAALDRKHIASELQRLLSFVEKVHGITKEELASNGAYFSHETGTHASKESSCAANEIAALRDVFGDALLSKILVLNTKGFTGHAMGVSFEDVTAVESLYRQVVPPVVNYTVKDDFLGDLNISRGGKYSFKYALRFAAGFGSQVSFSLYTSV